MHPAATNEAPPATSVPVPQEYDFYGLGVRIVTADEETAVSIHRDWKYFTATEAAPAAKGPTVEIHLNRDAPPFDAMPTLAAAMITPRNVCYRTPDTEYLDYFGRGLAMIDRATGRVEAWAADADLLREIAYLFLLSRIGQHVDTIGRHRIHALGICYRGKGLLVLLPVGGGKSTLALRLLERPDIEMLSEDTPLVDSRGMLYPFPLRLGVREGNEPAIPAEYMQRVRRMEFGPKTLIDLDYFGGRVAPPTPIAAILIGSRSSGRSSAIDPMSGRAAFRDVLANLVVGVGVYQGIEFILQRSWWELVYKVRPVWSRLHCGLQLLRRTDAYRFTLGRDSEANFASLERFIENDFAP
jgi:hypothetical protein